MTIVRQAKLMVSGLEGEQSVEVLQEALARSGAEGLVDLTTSSVEVAFDDEVLALEDINRIIEECGFKVM